MTPELAAGWSALAAAAANVVGLIGGNISVPAWNA
jgi:hypothetical protein